MGLVPAAHGGSVHVEPVAGSAGAAGLDGEVRGPGGETPDHGPARCNAIVRSIRQCPCI